jgi:hypothetical protein
MIQVVNVATLLITGSVSAMAALWRGDSLVVIGYALTTWFCLTLWLRSLILILSGVATALSQHGSVVTNGYARAGWFTRFRWLRSSGMVHSVRVATLSLLVSLEIDGCAYLA